MFLDNPARVPFSEFVDGPGVAPSEQIVTNLNFVEIICIQCVSDLIIGCSFSRSKHHKAIRASRAVSLKLNTDRPSFFDLANKYLSREFNQRHCVTL